MTMDSNQSSGASSQEGLDRDPKRNGHGKPDLPALISAALPFRRFSAGAASIPEPPVSPLSKYGCGASSGVPSTGFSDQDGSRNGTPQSRKKRSNSLIPQLAMPLSNILKSSGASSKDSSNSSLHDIAPPLTECTTQTPGSQGQVPGGGYHRRRRASMQDALDHTKINASLYQFDRPQLRKQESVGSIPEDSNLGSIHFSLTYDSEQGLLTVRLIQAVDLVPRDFSGTVDPYCRLRLLPNKRFQLQSRVVNKTRSPDFREEFIFDVSGGDVGSNTLEILVFDFDQYSRDECMGQVHVPLSHLELGREPTVLWRGFESYENDNQTVDCGEMMFSLAYLPSAERLTVVVMKARNLKCGSDGTSSKSTNPFARVTLTSGGKKLKRKKTSTKRNSANPVWNEALVFSVGKDCIKSIKVDMSVYSESLLGNSELIGKVVIGPNSAGEELSHWNDVINSKSALARWHHLSTNDDS